MGDHAGFSAERLGRLDRVLKQHYVEAGDIPNAAIQIWRGGELAHSGMWGWLDVERRTPIREDAIFRIYSMTKPITGVALLMLMEEGLIDLDDDVSRFIPAFGTLGVYEAGGRGAYRTRPPARPMRIVDLATHTSGLTYEWMNASPVDTAYLEANINRRDLPGGLKTMTAALGGIPLEFSPGERWNYSMSMDVLARIVEIVSGLRYSEFLRTWLFEPLGMSDTAYHCVAEKLDRLTTAYEIKGGRLTRDDRRTSLYTVEPSFEEGGAGLVSTTSDYMRFCRMLLGGGALDGVRILSPASVALFSTNMLPGGKTLGEMYVPGRGMQMRTETDGFSICCGVTLDPGQKHALGSRGDFYWSGAMMSQFWVDPTEELAVVFMTQVTSSPHHFRIPRVLRSLVYGAMTERRG
ncbi:MAG TPA: serine hydrolase domain-containing protein [Devosia sp.]